MSHRRGATALVILLALVSLSAQQPAGQPAPRPGAPSDALLARLPPDWRQPAGTLVALPAAQQQQLLAGTDEALRLAVARLLVRSPWADDFVKTQLRMDPSTRVRTAIVQAIAADARWLALPDTMPLLERVTVTDPDAGVSLIALEQLRRARLRGLSALLTERAAAASRSGDSKTLAQVQEEQERWISLERGTMLPAFMRTPPPLFSVAPADRPVRVLAFGDFGNGSPAQKSLAQTIVSSHSTRPFDIGITLGDNFYSVGMESPADPRWQTWWEQLYGPMGITFYPALGNHDWGHPDSPAAEILYSQKSTTWRMPASYYTYTAGPVQFFALDTQTIALSDKQLQWLDAELSRSRARWKVVYGHHPIYSGGNYEDRPDLILKLLPLLRNRVDIYMCGHDHNLQALKSDTGVRFYVVGGGGAGLYDLRPYDRSVFASRTNGFAVLEADAAQMTVTFVDGTGKQVYEDVIKKPIVTTSSGR